MCLNDVALYICELTSVERKLVQMSASEQLDTKPKTATTT